MTTKKAKWPAILIIVGAIAVYLHAHPLIPSKPATLTLEQGSAVEVRLDRAVSSKYSTDGERFSGKLYKAIVLNQQVVLPEGTEFSGTVIKAVAAGYLAGGASLRIALTSFELDGKQYTVQTTPILRVSQGKGRRTAEMAGGGAVLGAAIGALAHGRKGALIGAAAGAGAGAVGSGSTSNAHDIVMPAESPLTFRLAQPVVVTPKPAPGTQQGLAAMIRGLFS